MAHIYIYTYIDREIATLSAWWLAGLVYGILAEGCASRNVYAWVWRCGGLGIRLKGLGVRV